MSQSFAPFEEAISQVARRRTGQPRKAVLLARLYHFVGQSMSERLNRLLEPYQLNVTSWFALVMVYAAPETRANPCELSRFTASSRTNITRVVDDLVAKGWLEREACTQDRRRINLSITAAGTRQVETVLPVVWADLTALWQDFTADELVQFEMLLRKLLQSIETPPA